MTQYQTGILVCRPTVLLEGGTERPAQVSPPIFPSHTDPDSAVRHTSQTSYISPYVRHTHRSLESDSLTHPPPRTCHYPAHSRGPHNVDTSARAAPFSLAVQHACRRRPVRTVTTLDAVESVKRSLHADWSLAESPDPLRENLRPFLASLSYRGRSHWTTTIANRRSCRPFSASGVVSR